MYPQTFYIPRESGTYADVLLAFGLARVLNEISLVAGRYHATTRIRARGASYRVRVSTPIGFHDVQNAVERLVGLLPHVEQGRRSDAAGYPEHTSVVFMDEQWKRVRTFTEARRQFPEVNREHLRSSLGNRAPDPKFDVLSSLRGVEGAPVPDVTALSMLNPHQGKGINSAKANSVTLGNLRNFWIWEWLKFIGLFEAAVVRTVSTGRRSSDYKLYVLDPLNISLNAHKSILDHFRLRWGARGSIKLDILSLVQYAGSYLDYAHGFCGSDADEQSWEPIWNPADAVAGFYLAYFKDLGQAHAASNLTYLSMPPWIRVEGPHEIVSWKNLLDDFRRVAVGIEEEDSSVVELLQDCRAFLSAWELSHFLTFAASLGALVMRERARQGGRHRYIRQMATTTIEEVIRLTKGEYSKILASEGFKNIARAIRQSTISLQYLPRQQRPYQVRYGLAQELVRKSLYRDEFVAALAEFVSSYNRENARRAEREGRSTSSGTVTMFHRRQVTTDDLEEILELIDEFGTEVVGKLLVGYGYARVPREAEAEEASTSTEADEKKQQQEIEEWLSKELEQSL